MDETVLLRHLEDLAHSLGIEVRYDRLKGDRAFVPGGLCRVKDNRMIIINKAATTRQKTHTLARELRQFDLSNIYIIPALRDLLDNTS